MGRFCQLGPPGMNRIGILDARAQRVVTLDARLGATGGPRPILFYHTQDTADLWHQVLDNPPAMSLHVSTLRDVFMVVGAGRDSVVFDSEGNLLHETGFYTDAHLEEYTLERLHALAQPLDEHLVSLLDAGWRNYYHWTIIGLGRMMLYNSLCADRKPIVIYDYDTRNTESWPIGFTRDVWQKGLALSGVDQDIRLLDLGVYRIKALDLMSQSLGQPAFLTFLPKFFDGFSAMARTAKPFRRNRRIILARAVNPRATPQANEACDRLVRYDGFEYVALETMTFDEQLELWSCTDIVVATHGAGLANLLYAPAQTKVVEMNRAFAGETGLRPWFAILAMYKGQSYSYINLDDPAATAATIHDRVVELTWR